MKTEEECERIGILKMLAAFVDGEGSIVINKDTRNIRNMKPRYSQRIQVGNSDVRLIEWLVENFGGSFPKPSIKEDKKYKNVYYWTLSGSNSYKLIKRIQPFLIMKQEQANNAIELYEKVSRFRYGHGKLMPEHKRKLAEELYQRNRELNKTGKSDEDEVEVLVPVKVRKDVLDEWLEQ